MPHAHSREHAHELIEHMAPSQVAALVGLLESMLDPVSIALANAPLDDEPVSKEEACDITEPRAAYLRGETVSNEEVLVELGISTEDFERLGQTPLDHEPWLAKQ